MESVEVEKIKKRYFLFQVNYFLILQFFKTRQKQPKEELRMYLYWSFPVGTGGKK